jgi:hypothetical protein
MFPKKPDTQDDQSVEPFPFLLWHFLHSSATNQPAMKHAGMGHNAVNRPEIRAYTKIFWRRHMWSRDVEYRLLLDHRASIGQDAVDSLRPTCPLSNTYCVLPTKGKFYTSLEPKISKYDARVRTWSIR